MDPKSLLGVEKISQPASKTGFQVGVKLADGKPRPRVYVGVFQQKADLSGNPVWGDMVADGRTDDTGSVFVAAPPGAYGIRIGDIAGDAWGEPFNHTVTAGAVTALQFTLARLTIGVRDADGKAVGGRYTEIRLQKKDLSGNPIKGDTILSGRTDNTGLVSYDLFPGVYTVGIGDLAGYAWGEEFNHALPPGQTTSLVVTLGRLTVGIQDAEKKAVHGRYVNVRLQKRDLEGKTIPGNEVVGGRTSDTGLISWDLTEGSYMVEIEVHGAPWGDPFNHIVRRGETKSVVVTLGRLVVGLKDASGKALGGRAVNAYLPKQDAAGKTIKGNHVAGARTDDRGLAQLDLTAGVYIVDIEGFGTLNEVPLEAGSITQSDGTTAKVQ